MLVDPATVPADVLSLMIKVIYVDGEHRQEGSEKVVVSGVSPSVEAHLGSLVLSGVKPD